MTTTLRMHATPMRAPAAVTAGRRALAGPAVAARPAARPLFAASARRAFPISCAQARENTPAPEDITDSISLPELEGGVTIRRRPPGGHPARCLEVEFEIHEDETYKPINILEEIVWWKDYEVHIRKERTPLFKLRQIQGAAPPTRDFYGALKSQFESTGQPALIAEVKKASPSKGVIQPNFDPVKIAEGYQEGGAACLSVLTDEKFFQGSLQNLRLIRQAGVTCPLLCKEFIIDAYQIFEARCYGADAVLLIAAVLPNQDLTYFMKIAKSLGMAALIEVHTPSEMKRVLEIEGVELLGINNRDLGTFKVDLKNTKDLLEGAVGEEIRERGIMVVGESGIFVKDDIDYVQEAGCTAILVGESLVKQDDTAAAVKKMYGRE